MDVDADLNVAGRAPNMRPRNAATLILVDLKGEAPRILMGRRSNALAFMPGMYVFPGGRTDRADHTAPRSGSLRQPDLDRLLNGLGRNATAGKAEAIALSAIRETREETGLFVARMAKPDAQPPHKAWREFAERGLAADLSALRYVARAITPPGRVRRFDTRFFAARAEAIANPGELVARPRDELEDVLWVSLEQARTMPLPRITQAILDDLEDRIEADPDLTRDVPVPCHLVRHGRYLLRHE